MRVMTAKKLAAQALMGVSLGLCLTLAVPVINAVSPGQGWLTGGVAQAQLIRPGSPEVETRRIDGMRERTNNRLAEAQEFLQPPEDETTGEPTAEPNPTAALRILNDMARNAQDYNPFELAQIYRLMAFAYYMQDDIPRSIEYFERVVAQSPGISYQLEVATLDQIGRLYAAEENYTKAMEVMRRWAAMTNSINADQYYFLAQLLYQMDDAANSLLHVNEAIRMHEAANRVPQENWLVMQRVLYYEREDYVNATGSLKKLVRHYPSHEYWRQLAVMFNLLERQADQMHAMEANYLQGGLTSERDLMNLARYFMSADVPYKAAKVVSKGIYEDETIEATADNLEFLANAWRQAEEIRRSLVELERAAQKSSDGELFARLASLYLLDGQYEASARAGERAIREGGLGRPDQTWLIIGMALVNSHKFDEAVEAFEEAKKDDRSKDAAQARIAYTESERVRYERAREAGIL